MRDSQQFVRSDAAIGDADQALRAAGEGFIMGDDQQCGPGFGAAGEDQIDDRRASGGVEIAGGFIGKQQRGAGGEGAGDGHALLLAARELRGVMVEAVAKAYGGKFGGGAGFGIGDARQFERGHDIFERGHRGQQVKGLQHHADAPPAGKRKAIFTERREIGITDDQAARGGALQPGEHRHQAGFARAGGAEQRQSLALGHIKIQPFENGGGAIAATKREGEGAGDDGRLALRGLGHDRSMGTQRDFDKMRGGVSMRRWMVIGALGLLSACGGKAPEAPAGQASAAASAVPSVAPQGPVVRIVALGDSLFAGYGLRPEQAYPVRLEAALRARGINAQVVNAGVSGDTTEDGLARLDFTLGGGKVDLVVISLGGNDMLRGLPVARTRANMDAILTGLDKRKVPVVVMGMLAAPNMGPDYARDFNAVFPALSKAHHAALVPFFLKPIFGRADLQLPDHIHPTAPGVEAMVADTVGVVAGALPK